MKGETEVRRRIGLLDSAPPGATTEPDRLSLREIVIAIRVMGVITNTYYVGLYETIPTGRAEELDRIVAASQLVTGLSGPSFAAPQLWTEPSSSKLIPRKLAGPPSEATFRLAIDTAKPAVKPSTFGLYTSTRCKSQT